MYLPEAKRDSAFQEHISIESLECTVGIPSNLGNISLRDVELVRVLKHLGAVPFCRTNLPQTCISFDCSNPIYGKTVNPRNPERSPGGSSGGEGALIGGGGSVMGFGERFMVVALVAMNLSTTSDFIQDLIWEEASGFPPCSQASPV